MNTPDQHRCRWTTAGIDGQRCMCPAGMSASEFCIFHRHPNDVDVAGIVAWSQNASPEEYIARAQAFAYRAPSPTVQRLRAIFANRAGNAQIEREPGADEFEAAA